MSVDAVSFVIEITLVVVAPREVIVCRVLVFQTTTDPVEVDTAVSVPALKLNTPVLTMVTIPLFVLTDIPSP